MNHDDIRLNKHSLSGDIRETMKGVVVLVLCGVLLGMVAVVATWTYQLFV